MRIRFQADNDLNKAIVRAVVRREPAVDFRSAQVARFDNVPDPEVLVACAQAGRVLVSHDFQTMPDQSGSRSRRSTWFGLLPIRANGRTGYAWFRALSVLRSETVKATTDRSHNELRTEETA